MICVCLLAVCLFIHLRMSVHPPVYLSVCSSICLSVCSSTCLSVHSSVCLFICLSFCSQAVCTSVCLSLCSSICFPICSSVCLPSTSPCSAIQLTTSSSLAETLPRELAEEVTEEVTEPLLMSPKSGNSWGDNYWLIEGALIKMPHAGQPTIVEPLSANFSSRESPVKWDFLSKTEHFITFQWKLLLSNHVWPLILIQVVAICMKVKINSKAGLYVATFQKGGWGCKVVCGHRAQQGGRGMCPLLVPREARKQNLVLHGLCTFGPTSFLNKLCG